MINDLDFTGKNIYISGAANGIGRATALAFARAGASLTLVDQDADGNAETARQVAAAGAQVLDLPGDVSDEAHVQQALTRTVEEFGSLDIAFNNAGVEQDMGPLDELDPAQWDRIIDVNVRSLFLAMRHQVPLMKATGGGAIVNTSSGAGVKAFPGQAAYVAAKHAVVGLTRAAALDFAGQGIRINAVAPGIIDTPMRERVFGAGDEGYRNAAQQEPIGRLGVPEEIASAVLWLSSPGAAFTIGHTLVVDGGQTA
jgi:NAD(P)-dependent dehydrogenase (short-subunit alcohol dehydrogenase family)